MSKKDIIIIRVDPDVKQAAIDCAAREGMSLSSFVRWLLLRRINAMK